MAETVGGAASPVAASEVALINPMKDAGRDLLRSKKIQAVAFNDVSPSVLVFLKRAVPSTRRQSLMPTAVGSIPVYYRQGVQKPVIDTPALPHAGPTYVIRTTPAGLLHYTCGSSISVGNFRDAGTLGCLVRHASGALFGLSNNHVTGSCSFAGVGLPILAPGVFDVVPGCLPPFTIGFHHSALPLVAGSIDNVDHTKNLDAAIFAIRDQSLVSSFQGTAYDTPATASALEVESNVEKVGRTTGHTAGRVVAKMNGAYGFPYTASLYGFNGSVFFDDVYAIVGTSGLFSDHGDSGSLITTSDAAGERRAVGIVVGGMDDGKAPGGKLTLALPISRILNDFGVSLVSGHNV